MKWVDVEIIDTDNETEAEIRLYYTAEDLDNAEVGIDEGTLRIRWWDGSEWIQCSPGNNGINMTHQAIEGTQYLGYMWAIINQGTTPSPPLAGAEFGGYGHPSTDFDVPCGMATLADVTPFALVSAGIVAVWATKRKGKAS
jgi:hypothetical protein